MAITEDLRRAGGISGSRPGGAQADSDHIEIGALDLCRMVGFLAAFEGLDLGEIFKRFVEMGFGIRQLAAQFVCRPDQIVAPGAGRPRISRVSKVARVGNAGALFFHRDFAVEINGHAGKFGNHGFDLASATTFLFDLETPEAD
jgi:hypothetical protein